MAAKAVSPVAMTTRSQNPPSLASLPVPVLLDIFQHLKLRDIPAVSAACRAFHSAFYGDAGEKLWERVRENSERDGNPARLGLIGQRRHCRCNLCQHEPTLPKWQQIQLSLSWRRDRSRSSSSIGDTCTELTLQKFGRCQRLMPHLQLHSDSLLFTRANRVVRLRLCGDLTGCRQRQRQKQKQEAVFCDVGDSADVTTFARGSDRLLGATSDGRVLLWLDNRPGKPAAWCHLTGCPYVSGCDWLMIDRLAAAACKDGSVRILAAGEYSSSSPSVRESGSFDCGDRVYCVRCLATNGCLAVIGCAGLPDDARLQDSSLLLADLSTLECVRRLADVGLDRRGSGICAVAVRHDGFVSVGYDSVVRRWDPRARVACVGRWEDPTDCCGTAVQTDNSNAILVGLQRHGLVRLYDCRLARPLAAFFKGANYQDRVPRFTRSPVYSLDFNIRCFVRAIDSEINCVAF